MKVFLKADKNVGIAIHRTVHALEKYHPSGVEIVQNHDDADFALYHIIGANCTGQIRKKHYALWMHCYKTAGIHDWVGEWKRAYKVFSSYDLEKDSGTEVSNFVQSALGYEPSDFYPCDFHSNIQKKYTALTTGYVAYTEIIDQLFEAVKLVDGKLVHVGPDFGWDRKHYIHVNGISDTQMRQLYCESRFANGMRIAEGFELPALEGLACGTPALLLDLPCYRFWYHPFAVHWIDSENNITEQLVKIFQAPAKTVFNYPPYTWKAVANLFWSKVLG